MVSCLKLAGCRNIVRRCHRSLTFIFKVFFLFSKYPHLLSHWNNLGYFWCLSTKTTFWNKTNTFSSVIESTTVKFVLLNRKTGCKWRMFAHYNKWYTSDCKNIKTPPPKARNIHHSTSSSKNVLSGKSVNDGIIFSFLSFVLQSLKTAKTFWLTKTWRVNVISRVLHHPKIKLLGLFTQFGIYWLSFWFSFWFFFLLLTYLWCLLICAARWYQERKLFPSKNKIAFTSKSNLNDCNRLGKCVRSEISWWP